MMANAARGETTLMIGGAERTLCLTLGALAMLESAFEADSIEALAARLGKFSANDLIVVVAALAGMTTSEVARADIDLAEAALAVGEAFERAFG